MKRYYFKKAIHRSRFTCFPRIGVRWSKTTELRTSFWLISYSGELISVARILSGGALFGKIVNDPFLVVALKDRLNIPPNLSHAAKTVLLQWLGVHFVSWGAITHFSCKLGLKKFFSPPWRCRCTHCTPGYAYGRALRQKLIYRKPLRHYIQKLYTIMVRCLAHPVHNLFI